MLMNKVKRIASLGILLIMGAVTADSMMPREAEAVANVAAVVYVASGWWKGSRAAQPSHYTDDDLLQSLTDHRGYFGFDNWAPPISAVAQLPNASPNRESSYGILRRGGLTPHAVQSADVAFPWTDHRLRAGQIVTVKGTGGYSKMISRFSTWTHDAFIYDPSRRRVFESNKDSSFQGVALRDIGTKWDDGILAYSVKTVRGVNGDDVMEDAIRRYDKRPYRPSILRSLMTLTDIVKKWSDKTDPDSMYCSKLIWNAFNNYHIDLDSDRTYVYVGAWQEGRPKRANGWIGVSPDDIYYSENMETDIVTSGLNNLGVGIVDEAFRAE